MATSTTAATGSKTKEIWTIAELEEEITIGLDGKKLSKNEPRCQPFSGIHSCPSDEQVMLIACRDGDLETVKRLAKEDPRMLVEPDRVGLYPIHTAIIGGHLEVAHFLLDVQGSSVNYLVDSFIHKPIHLATYCRATKLVKRLVEECGADCQDFSTLKTKNRVVHLAAMTGSVELLRYLVEEMPEDLSASKRAAVTDQNRWNESVIFSTLFEDRLETFLFCLERNPGAVDEEDDSGLPLFWCAVSWGATRIVNYMIEHGMERKPTKKPSTPNLLFSAIRSGCLELIQQLHAGGMHIADMENEEKESPAIWAVGHGHFEILKFLVDVCGVSPSKATPGGTTPLSIACSEGELEIAKYLHAKRTPQELVEPQFSGNPSPRLTLLNMAARACRFSVMEWLLDNHICDVNYQDACGYTALMGAAEENQPIVIDFLIARGADVLVSNDNLEYFSSAFLVAVANGHIDAMEALYKHEESCILDMNFPGHPQWTCNALHVALSQGHLEVAKWLVAHDPNKGKLPERSNTDSIEWPLNGRGSFQIIHHFVHVDGDKEILTFQSNPHVLSVISDLAAVRESKDNDTRLACLEWLITEGLYMDQDLPDNDPVYQLRPSFTVVLEKNLKALKLIVEKGCVELDMEAASGYSLLDLAASHGDLEIFKYIAEKIKEKKPDFDFDQEGSDDWSPLFHAADKGRLAIIQYLTTECGVDIKKSMKLEANEEDGDLLHLDADDTRRVGPGNRQTDRLFLTAAAGGNVEVWKLLEKELGFTFVPVTTSSRSWVAPLHEAIVNGHVALTEYLLDEVKLPEAARSDTLMAAITPASGPQILEFFFGRGMSLNASPNPVILACEAGNLRVLKWLHKMGLSVLVRDADGYSSTMVAAAQGHLEVVKWLLAQGASRTDRNSLGGPTLSSLAARSSNRELSNLFAELLDGFMDDDLDEDDDLF